MLTPPNTKTNPTTPQGQRWSVSVPCWGGRIAGGSCPRPSCPGPCTRRARHAPPSTAPAPPSASASSLPQPSSHYKQGIVVHTILARRVSAFSSHDVCMHILPLFYNVRSPCVEVWSAVTLLELLTPSKTKIRGYVISLIAPVFNLKINKVAIVLYRRASSTFPQNCSKKWRRGCCTRYQDRRSLRKLPDPLVVPQNCLKRRKMTWISQEKRCNGNFGDKIFSFFQVICSYDPVLTPIFTCMTAPRLTRPVGQMPGYEWAKLSNLNGLPEPWHEPNSKDVGTWWKSPVQGHA